MHSNQQVVLKLQKHILKLKLQDQNLGNYDIPSKLIITKVKQDWNKKK